MTTSAPRAPPPHIRVFAKVAHPAPPGPSSPAPVAAVVRFYLRGFPLLRLPLEPSYGYHVEGPPSTPTVERTFQFGELRTFLEVDKARAAVSGMLALLPLDLAVESFQAWSGFISSVLGVAASLSQRGNLGGMLGIVRIDCFEAAEGGLGGEPASSTEVNKGDGLPGGAPRPPEASCDRRHKGSARSSGEEGSGELEDRSCPICWEGFGFGFGPATEAARMPCGHDFHSACIARWLQRRRTCPVCRLKLSR